MQIIQSKIFTDVKIFIPKIYEDDRGIFFESYNKNIDNVLGISFFQENQSKSKKNVIRGIHYQWNKPMGKLARVTKGSGFDFLIDLRISSDTFGKYELVYLSEYNFKQIWIPEGFGHAFLSLEDDTQFCYKCSTVYNLESEGCINPLDNILNIDWPINYKNIILSEKDKKGQGFNDYISSPKF
jgi:dTDP-4-dehydrorhamnose 3,5-epimerase